MELSIRICDYIKIISNSNNHNYIIGETYQISFISDLNGTFYRAISLINCNFEGNNLQKEDFILVNNIEQMKKKLLVLQQEIKEVEDIVQWMEKNHLENFDRDVYYATKAIQEIKESNSEEKLIKIVTEFMRKKS